MLRLIALIIVIAGGKFAYDEFNRPGSQFHDDVMNVVSDIRTELNQSGGSMVVNYDDYESTAAGRPNLMGYSARQPGNGGTYREPRDQWGRTDNLAQAHAEWREAYRVYQERLSRYGWQDRETERLRQAYKAAEEQYNYLSSRAMR